MIEGKINDRYEAVITITVTGPAGASAEVPAVIDTGFNGFLCLPEKMMEELGMPFLHSRRVRLADDREAVVRVHQAELDWDGVRRTVRATASGTTALVGMRLMNRHRLEMDIRPDGAVQIHSP